MDALDSSVAQGLAQDREKLEEHLVFVLFEELLQQKSVVVGGCRVPGTIRLGKLERVKDELKMLKVLEVICVGILVEVLQRVQVAINVLLQIFHRHQGPGPALIVMANHHVHRGLKT